MVMEEVIEKLRTLQEILAEKISLEKEIQDIPKLLSTQEELLARLKKTYIEKNAQYEQTRARVSELRGALADAETSREKAEKAMDTISTQREYEALDKEIRDASEREQQYRKDLQREERYFLELDEEQKRDEALIAQQEVELENQGNDIGNQLASKNSEKQALEEREQEISPGLDPDVLFKFERIIRSKHGLGIVAIKGGVCSGCHMILPSQFANMVREGEDIVFCPYCSRILFYQEADQSEQDFFDDEDAGSLSDLDDLDEEDEDSYDMDDGDGSDKDSDYDD